MAAILIKQADNNFFFNDTKEKKEILIEAP